MIKHLKQKSHDKSEKDNTKDILTILKCYLYITYN